MEVKLLRACFARLGYDPRRGTSAVGVTPLDFIRDCFDDPAHGVPKAAQLERVRKAVGRERGDSGAAAVAFPAANPHLYRQFVGRGAYSIMLEHWYALLPKAQIKVLCTDDIASSASAAPAMRDLARFIGLGADFDFEATVARGKFNAANQRGYSKVTSWEADASTHEARAPMPPLLREALLDFYRPLNERLFELSGNRCPWPLLSTDMA